MSSFSPTNCVSEDATAILLLCAFFGKRPKDSVAPLSVSEYAQLADNLRSLGLRPSRLLDADAAFLGVVTERFTGRNREKITTERMLRLLERGGLLALALSRWSSAGVWIISRADAGYPSRYKRKLGRSAPPIVYGIGPTELVDHGGLAVVGSRQPDPDSEAYTYQVGRWAATAGVQIVSGAARGVDEISMLSCVQAGGTSIGVVAESLLRMSTRREFRDAIIDKRLTLLSSYDPDAAFSVGNAMGRNRWVYALANQALVVACSEGRGGTWAGAIEALRQGMSVYVKTGNPARPGNDALVLQGATPAPENLSEIVEASAVQGATPAPENLSEIVEASAVQGTTPAPENLSKIVEASVVQGVTPALENRFGIIEDRVAEGKAAVTRVPGAFDVVAPLILGAVQNPATLQDVAEALGLVDLQASIWLERLVAEGKLEKAGPLYHAAITESERRSSLRNQSDGCSGHFRTPLPNDSTTSC